MGRAHGGAFTPAAAAAAGGAPRGRGGSGSRRTAGPQDLKRRRVYRSTWKIWNDRKIFFSSLLLLILAILFSVYEEPKKALVLAARDGDGAAVARLLAAGADPNALVTVPIFAYFLPWVGALGKMFQQITSALNKASEFGHL